MFLSLLPIITGLAFITTDAQKFTWHVTFKSLFCYSTLEYRTSQKQCHQTDSSYYLHLSPSQSHCFSFCLKCPGPSLSQSSFTLSLCVPTQSSFFYGSGILPLHRSNPLPFLQSHLLCYLFLLCMLPQFFIQENVWPKELKNFPKATY